MGNLDTEAIGSPVGDAERFDIVPANWDETYRSWARRAVRGHPGGGGTGWLAEPSVGQRLVDVAALVVVAFAFYALYAGLSTLGSG